MYRNPIPVVVGIVFLTESTVLAVTRAIEPCVGGIALPGGYVEEGDDWRERLQWEVFEETNVVVAKEAMYLYDARTTPDGKKLLLFAVVPPEGVVEVQEFTPNEEVSVRCVLSIDDVPSLCFSLHEEVLRQYLKQ